MSVEVVYRVGGCNEQADFGSSESEHGQGVVKRLQD